MPACVVRKCSEDLTVKEKVISADLSVSALVIADLKNTVKQLKF